LHSEAHRNEQVRVVRQEHRQLTRITERHFPEKISDGKRKKCVVCSSTGASCIGKKKTTI